MPVYLIRGEGWRLCKAGITLMDQFDSVFPKRDHSSDGTIGDPSHTTGDHVPDYSLKPAVVRATDIDAGLSRTDPEAMERAMNQLRKLAQDAEDKRIKYIIFDRKIASPVDGWDWRAYYGDNPHTLHAHISYTVYGDDRDRPFRIPILRETW